MKFVDDFKAICIQTNYVRHLPRTSVQTFSLK